MQPASGNQPEGRAAAGRGEGGCDTSRRAAGWIPWVPRRSACSQSSAGTCRSNRGQTWSNMIKRGARRAAPRHSFPTQCETPLLASGVVPRAGCRVAHEAAPGAGHMARRLQSCARSCTRGGTRGGGGGSGGGRGGAAAGGGGPRACADEMACLQRRGERRFFGRARDSPAACGRKMRTRSTDTIPRRWYRTAPAHTPP